MELYACSGYAARNAHPSAAQFLCTLLRRVLLRIGGRPVARHDAVWSNAVYLASMSADVLLAHDCAAGEGDRDAGDEARASRALAHLVLDVLDALRGLVRGHQDVGLPTASVASEAALDVSDNGGDSLEDEAGEEAGTRAAAARAADAAVVRPLHPCGIVLTYARVALLRAATLVRAAAAAAAPRRAGWTGVALDADRPDATAAAAAVDDTIARLCGFVLGCAGAESSARSGELRSAAQRSADAAVESHVRLGLVWNLGEAAAYVARAHRSVRLLYYARVGLWHFSYSHVGAGAGTWATTRRRPPCAQAPRWRCGPSPRRS